MAQKASGRSIDRGVLAIGFWMVLADQQGVGRQLAERLRSVDKPVSW